jgi:L-ascorbate 6-phosphate lactonase
LIASGSSENMKPMIQPIQSGPALLNDIQFTTLQAAQVAIWWLGQSGYAIKTTSTLFYVDLYLSEHLTAKYTQTEKPHIRMTEAPLRGNQLTDVPLVFASHKHSDHLDPGTMPDLFAACPEAKLVLPAAITDYATGLGLDRERLIPTLGDETLQLGALTIHSLPSAHPDFAYSEQEGYPFLGFVFQVDGLSIYHSGDTLAYEGLAERLQDFHLDIAFLPINGTDARRDALHVPPNMNMDEALALARAAEVKLMIPHHYDMFTFNTADVTEFEVKAREQGQAYRVLHCGEKFIYPG